MKKNITVTIGISAYNEEKNIIVRVSTRSIPSGDEPDSSRLRSRQLSPWKEGLSAEDDARLLRLEN